MGDTDEARDAATMIMSTPDPAGELGGPFLRGINLGKLLREFARGSARTSQRTARSSRRRPPPDRRRRPQSPSSPPSGRVHPQGLEAAAKAAASQPRPKPASLRPEFTREGLEAAARAARPVAVVALVPTNPTATPGHPEPPRLPWGVYRYTKVSRLEAAEFTR